MKNFKFSLLELERKPFFSILTIIQLIVSFVLIYMCLAFSNSVSNKVGVVDNIFNGKNYYTINSNNTNYLTEIDVDNIQEFMNMIDSRNIDVYSVSTDSLPIKCSDISPDKIVGFGGEDNGYNQVKVIYVNSNYINNIGIDLSEGEFNDNSYVPVILGEGYRNQFKIGDKIESVRFDLNENIVNETLMDIKKIEKSTSNSGLNFKFESNNEKIDEFIKENSSTLWQIRVFVIFILFFTIISIIIVMINSINDNSKEYGINMMVGASNKDIACRILYQMSTLLNILGGIDTPTSGEYYLNKNNIATLSNKKIADIRNIEFGFVLQYFGLINDYTVYENVMLPLKYSNKFKGKERKNRVNKMIEDMGLKEKLKKYPTELSGGQCQRVAIARAIVNNPNIIFADEPTGALDRTTGNQIFNILRELNKEGKTVVIVSHDENIYSKCDRIIKIEDGQIISDSIVGV